MFLLYFARLSPPNEDDNFCIGKCILTYYVSLHSPISNIITRARCNERSMKVPARYTSY